jgi:uncharacterized protein
MMLRVDDLQVEVAATFLSRFVGLLGRKGLPPRTGLLLVPCSNIHTGFMRFTIDAVFLDREGTVLAVYPALRPWRAAIVPGAHACLELASGEAERAGLVPGRRLPELSAQACRQRRAA